jgi:hypothetical protein
MRWPQLLDRPGRQGNRFIAVLLIVCNYNWISGIRRRFVFQEVTTCKKPGGGMGNWCLDALFKVEINGDHICMLCKSESFSIVTLAIVLFCFIWHAIHVRFAKKILQMTPQPL